MLLFHILRIIQYNNKLLKMQLHSNLIILLYFLVIILLSTSNFNLTRTSFEKFYTSTELLR